MSQLELSFEPKEILVRTLNSMNLYRIGEKNSTTEVYMFSRGTRTKKYVHLYREPYLGRWHIYHIDGGEVSLSKDERAVLFIYFTHVLKRDLI